MKRSFPSAVASCATLAAIVALGAGAPSRGAVVSILSPLQKLVIENQINQQIVLYGLLADGDGVTHKDVQSLADMTLAPDVVTDVILPNGQTISHTNTSAAVVAATPAPTERPAAGRHFLVSTYFDEVTLTTARTRTTTLYLEAIKNTGPGCETRGPDACGGRVTHAVTVVYHDTWKRTPGGVEEDEKRALSRQLIVTYAPGSRATLNPVLLARMVGGRANRLAARKTLA